LEKEIGVDIMRGCDLLLTKFWHSRIFPVLVVGELIFTGNPVFEILSIKEADTCSVSMH